MERTPVIEFKDFSFRYRSQREQTLKNINLTIYEGEKVLILGPSGCGKSTLAHCINGLIPFSFPGEIQGSIKVAGRETQNSSIFNLSSLVGTVLQDSDAQFVGLSVGEDIAYALENNTIPRAEMLPRVAGSANIVGMSDFLDHVPYNLSGGQKQRVALAGIMHDDVKILLFDEPLAALDPQMGNQAIDLIDQIQKANNKACIIIEHRFEDVLYRDLDRVILMQDGQIVYDGTPDQLICTNLLKEKGVREPLYISALKYAGCSISEADNPSNITKMNLQPYQKQILDSFHSTPLATIQNSNEVIVSVENVSYQYQHKTEALDQVSFEIHKGEKVAVIGKNGAGKSTMAKMLSGIIRPQTGKIEIRHENYLKFSIKEIGKMIGYVMQNPNNMLVKDIIKEEVSLGLQLHQVDPAQINANVEEALKMCELWPMRNWPINSISYGQKKRVTIASILAMKPEIIVLDEPTAGQDYLVYTEIMTFLDQLNRDYGITILFITHDLHLAIEYTDRAIVFADAKCIADDSIFKILSNPEIIAKANLKQTSLYTLATRLHLPAEDFINYFISMERGNRHES